MATSISEQEAVRMEESSAPAVPGATGGFWIFAGFLLATVVCGCAVYANLAHAVTDGEDYRFFPPFKPLTNANNNKHLGAEYLNIARSLAAGEGFANPFNSDKTGPTAWMPPVLPAILAAMLWVCDGNRDAVMAVVVFLQVSVLIGTAILVLVLARQTTGRMWAVGAAAVFVAILLCDFHSWFQFTHDSWLVLLAVDLLIAGLCWFGPFENWRRATVWGVFGGFCALINPIVALAWGVLSLGASGIIRFSSEPRTEHARGVTEGQPLVYCLYPLFTH